MNTNYVKMQGLKADAVYQEQESGKRYTGNALMKAGIPMPSELGEYLAYQMHFVEVEEE